jgi:O-antigen ligase
LVYYFTGLIVFSALVSFAGYLFDFSIYNRPLGIVVANHATQGMLFSVAMFACLVLSRFPLSSDFFPGWLLKCSAGLLALNILFVTPGRSGYLASIVLVMAFSFWGIKKKTRIVFMLLAPVVILSLLLVSPVAQDRIRIGLDEIENYKQSPELTAMGVRIVMWKNTVEILKKFEHPVLGYGTNGFETAYREQVVNEKGWQGEPVGDPHNQYLRILVEYGVVGLMLFLLFISSFFRQRIRGRSYILGIGVLLAWCATSMFNPHFTTFVEGRFLMIWCSTLLSVNISQTTESLDL